MNNPENNLKIAIGKLLSFSKKKEKEEIKNMNEEDLFIHTQMKALEIIKRNVSTLKKDLIDLSKKKRKMTKQYEKGHEIEEIRSLIGVSRKTFYKDFNKLPEELKIKYDEYIQTCKNKLDTEEEINKLEFEINKIDICIKNKKYREIDFGYKEYLEDVSNSICNFVEGYSSDEDEGDEEEDEGEDENE